MEFRILLNLFQGSVEMTDLLAKLSLTISFSVLTPSGIPAEFFLLLFSKIIFIGDFLDLDYFPWKNTY